MRAPGSVLMKAHSPACTWEKAGSVTAVVIVHVVVGWWLLVPRDMPRKEHVVGFVLVPIPVEETKPLTLAPNPPDRMRTGDPSLVVRPTPAVQPAPPDASLAVPGAGTGLRSPSAPAPLVEGEDRWDRPSRGSMHDFRPPPLGGRPEPVMAPPPERFAMREALSPRDIVRGVAQVLGFWPPGYTDDPCGGIQRSVELLSGADDAASRRQLVDAVQARAKYCR